MDASSILAAHAELALVRHGESVGNREERFSGWRDVALTELGREQARTAGRILRQRGADFSAAFSSELVRAVDTCRELLAAYGHPELPWRRHWRLNERHCGAMHGLDKEQCKALWGSEQARVFRRSWDVAPPASAAGGPDDPRLDPRYRDVGAPLPLSESMGDLARRVRVVWDEELRPLLLQGQRLLVVGHGMALRALALCVEDIQEPALPPWKLASAAPRCYRLDAALRVLSVESVAIGSEAPRE